MQVEVAGDQPRRAGATPIARDRGRRRRAERGVGGEPEVVVGGEKEHPTALAEHLGVGRAAERPQVSAKACRVESAELGSESVHAGVMPAACHLVNLENHDG